MSKHNPKAVALRYDSSRDMAPKVAATGRGEVARRIVRTAQEVGVPIREDPDLLEVLATIPLGEEIPPDLYQTVAEILVFLYRLNGRYGEGNVDRDR
jgi:flagellar biosynthesis protein